MKKILSKCIDSLETVLHLSWALGEGVVEEEWHLVCIGFPSLSPESQNER